MSELNNGLIAPQPEHCPGPKSEQAGKSEACLGCPNQNICESAKPNIPDPDLPLIHDRMSTIQHKILILSGKGGVGKSTISSQFSFWLASLGLVESDDQPSIQVGLLDIDICGPSIPRIMGLLGQGIHQSNLGWEPAYVQENLAVMSVGFLLKQQDEAVIWRGPRKNGMIKQFLRDVHWGELDYLIIDTPPGTSDEHLSITSYLRQSGITGAVIVSTPQEVSLADVRKEINFCRKVKIPILGVMENMSSFICPHCATKSTIFPSSTGGASKMCKDMNVPFLGTLSCDPLVARHCDQGRFFMAHEPISLIARQLQTIFNGILTNIKKE